MPNFARTERNSYVALSFLDDLSVTHISRETRFTDANVEVEKLKMSKKDNGKSLN